MPIVCDFATNPSQAWGVFFRHQKRAFQRGKGQNYKGCMEINRIRTKQVRKVFWCGKEENSFSQLVKK